MALQAVGDELGKSQAKLTTSQRDLEDCRRLLAAANNKIAALGAVKKSETVDKENAGTPFSPSRMSKRGGGLTDMSNTVRLQIQQKKKLAQNETSGSKVVKENGWAFAKTASLGNNPSFFLML